jgi:lysozyme
MLTTSLQMRKLIESWEGKYLTAYYDPVHVITIGYGHTGPDVHPGQIITEVQADQLLSNDLHKFEISVTNLIANSPTNQHQFDALVSFAYNLGSGALKGSTLLKYHLSKNYVAASKEFSKWDHAGGIVLAGLLRRREGEAQVYLSGVYPNG